jgi:TctA family transporter
MMQQGPEGCPSGPFAQRLTALLPAVSAATAEVTASEVTAHGGKAAVVTVARIDIAQITIGVFRVH